ncbi:hypothetical protein OG754_40335 (plasmid) [Streptomyces decoyicus]|uniref:hypothetical protein n=1 Tax=Streptomyces decoyicus TaxID=249567 RepID=UPI002E335F89|nr:hypothetical protein [Streptomyces decoyicus]
MASVITPPRSGLSEEIKRTESDDNGRGFERDETDAYQRLMAWQARRVEATDAQHRLDTYVLRLVAEADARIAARTAAKVAEKAGCAA